MGPGKVMALARAVLGFVGINTASSSTSQLVLTNGTAATPAVTGTDTDSGVSFSSNRVDLSTTGGTSIFVVPAQMGHAMSTSGTGNPRANFFHASETVSLSGASTASTTLIPAGARLLGVTYRVTTAVTGATSFDVGDGSDVDRFGDNIAVTLGTTGNETNYTADPMWWTAAARAITFTGVGGSFSGGVVRLHVYYLTFTAPTS